MGLLARLSVLSFVSRTMAFQGRRTVLQLVKELSSKQHFSVTLGSANNGTSLDRCLKGILNLAQG